MIFWAFKSSGTVGNVSDAFLGDEGFVDAEAKTHYALRDVPAGGVLHSDTSEGYVGAK